MSKIVNLGDRRPPVTYTVRITHHWDDRLEVFVEDVADDDRSRTSVADSLFRAASMFEKKAALSASPSPVGDRDGLIERLVKALKPFAKAADNYNKLVLGEDIDHWPCKAGDVTLGDLREARAALSLPEHAEDRSNA